MHFFKISSTILLAVLFLCCEVWAGIGMNSWDDDREPSGGSSSFGLGDVFMLIWIVISFLLVTVLFNFIHDNISSNKMQVASLFLIPGLSFYVASYFNSGALNLFAFGSVISAIYYSAVLRRD